MGGRGAPFPSIPPSAPSSSFSLGQCAGRKPLKKRIAYLGESAQVLERGVEVHPFLDLLDLLRGEE